MSISEPFVLATYASTLRGAVRDRTLVGAYTSVHRISNKLDEYVTVAAQADSVHILDVSDLHPVISHTLGPSTYFTCPALTLTTSKSFWTTYAIISSSPELASVEDAGRTLYMWKIDLASNEKHQSKTTKVLFEKGQTVHGLYVCDEMKGRIVAISCASDITILEAESLEIKANWRSSSNEITVQYAWLLLVPHANLQRPIAVVLYSGASNMIHLRILAFDEAESISQFKDESTELSVEKIISASCNSSGYLSILTSDGIWFSYNLLPYLNASEPTSLLSNRTKPLHLTNFSWLTSVPSGSRPPVATISLTSSHVLLASASPQEAILHIWDLQFGVLLTSYTLPIPASLTSTSSLHLALVSGKENFPGPKAEIVPTSQVLGQVYLLVSSMVRSRKETQKETKIASSVFVIPYAVPWISTIAGAMGRGTVSQRWLKDEPSSMADKTTKPGVELSADLANKKLLAVKAALQEGRTQAAETIFLKWISSRNEEEPQMTTLGYNFVQELLVIVFALCPESRPRTISAYPAQIIHHILERGVVSSAMIASHGGLLSLLRAHSDWKAIELALRKVPDLTEVELVETLKTILILHRQNVNGVAHPPDAMQVDSELPSVPSEPDSSNSMPLERYLRLMMNYPTTRIPLLLSFIRHLQDPEDITILLRLLSDWFTKRSQITAEEECHELLPGPKDVKKTTEGVWIVVGKSEPAQVQETVPSLEKITSLISTLLDSSFLCLLSYKPSHPILRTISSQIEPELAFIHAAQNLRGGLEPFALLQARTLRDSLLSKADKEKQKQKGDWRQRKKGVGGVTGDPGADVGMYTLEELVL